MKTKHGEEKRVRKSSTLPANIYRAKRRNCLAKKKKIREKEIDRESEKERETERREPIPSGENSISLQDRPGAAIGQFSP